MNESLPNESKDLESAVSFWRFEFVLLAVAMTAIGAVTIIGNTLVLLSFLLDKKLRTLSNYFILSLAVSDTMIGTFAMPLFTLYVLNGGEWTLGPVLCDMWLAQDYMCSCASSLNLLMIACDRYFSVVSPLRYRVRRNGKLVAAMISFVWVLAFLMWPPWIYSWQYIEGNRTVPDDDCYVQFLETNSYLTITTAAIAYYIPVSIICFLYFRIWRETVKRKQFLAGMVAENHSRSASLQSKAYVSDARRTENSCSSETQISNGRSHRAMEEKVELSTMALSSPQSATPGTPSQCGESHCNRNFEVSTTLPSTNPSNDPQQSAGKKSAPTQQSFSINSAPGKQDNKAARMLSAILCAFLVTSTPYNVVVVIKNLDTSRTLVPNQAWFFIYYLFYVNSALNPVCYALANERFRKTYWKILKCSWSRKSTDSLSFIGYPEKKSPGNTFKTSKS